jgi:hypothetical protein
MGISKAFARRYSRGISSSHILGWYITFLLSYHPCHWFEIIGVVEPAGSADIAIGLHAEKQHGA